ncbi:hypothetical protein SB861_37905 [Paraburkholderia sp. SIMBA_049]
MTARIKPVCTDCGSDNVCFDAWSEWDVETQQYELSNTFDEAYCQGCDGSCKVEWQEAKE